MTRLGPSGCLLAATLVLGGCARPFAKLNGVLVEAQPDPHPASAQDSSRVRVTQSGAAAAAGRRSMAIRKGDAVATTADGIGLMVLADGYQVILDPGTDLTIENPSILLRVGRVIVKRIGQIREALTVKTEFGAAAVEGTEFVFEVDPGGRARVSVLEGRVTVFPRAARWRDTVAVSAREGVEYDSLRITRLPLLAAEVERALRRRIAVIEQASIPPGKPFWQKPAFFGPALAAGVAAAVVVLTSGSDTRGGTVTVHIPF